MNRALWYLLARRRVNGARHWVRGLTQPKRLIGSLFWLGLITLMIWGQVLAQRQHGRVSAESSAAVLKVLVAMTLIMSVLGGIVQRGLAFQPADIDFLFPGPFTRRELILFRLCSLYPLVVLSSFFLLFIFGYRVPNRGLAFIGLVLAQIVTIHVQAIASLLAVTIREAVFARWRRGIQLAATAVAAIGIIVLVNTMFQTSSFATRIRELLDLPVARFILYPAVAIEDLALADGSAAIARALGMLLLLVLGTLAITVLLEVRFFEASLETSRRVARVLALAGRGIPATTGRDGEQYRENRLPAIPMFRGAGAVFWKNIVVLSRSLRTLLFTVILVSMVATSLAVFLRQSAGQAERIDLVVRQVLGMCALLPVFVQNQLAFDFRRDLEMFDVLKQLPAHPTRLALAEVALPTVIALVCQLGLFIPLIAYLDLPVDILWCGLMVFPVTTLGVCTISNVGFMLFPIRTVTASGRPNPGSASLFTVFNMLALFIALLPALLSFAWVEAHFESSSAGIAAGLVMQIAVDFALLTLLGWLFQRFDIARE